MSVFLSIPMVQLLHSHTVSAEHSKISKQKIEVSSHIKCEICDYLSHISKKQAFHSTAIEIIVPTVKYFVRKSFFACTIFEQCIQAFTNKGPPRLA